MANPVQPQFPPAREPGTASPTDLPEMEKLLTKVEGKNDKPLKLSKSLSGALDLEQNGHGLPFKVVSEGHQEATLPWSPSRASSRRASSVVTASSAQDQEVPRDYLILAITSCFCPVWPLNLIPLIFSIMVSAAGFQGRGKARARPGLSRHGPLGGTRHSVWVQSRGAGGSGEDSPSHLACYPPLERGPGTGDLLFAVLPHLRCSCSASQINLARIPAGEGTPGSRLELNSTQQKDGQVGVGAACLLQGVSRGVILSEAVYQQRLWPVWVLRTPSSQKGSQLPPPPIPGHLGILTAFASSGFQELWLPCHALRALGPGSPEAAPLWGGVFAGGPLGFVATPISASVFRVGENV